MTTQAAAPSDSWLAFPAVIVPPSVTGGSEASPSAVVPGRLHSSALSVTGPRCTSPGPRSTTRRWVEMGTISASKRPFSCAAAFRS